MTIPLVSDVEQVVAQAVSSLNLPSTTAEVTDWTETPSGLCFVEFTAPSSTWAHTIGSTVLALFRARGQEILVSQNSNIISIQVAADFE